QGGRGRAPRRPPACGGGPGAREPLAGAPLARTGSAATMKYLFLAVFSMLAIVAQMIAGNGFLLFNLVDLSMILIAYWAIERSRTQALFVGSITGVLLDAALGWPIGYHGFGKTIGAFVVGVAARRFNVEGAPIRFAVITVASCLSSGSVFLLFQLLGRHP